MKVDAWTKHALAWALAILPKTSSSWIPLLEFKERNDRQHAQKQQEESNTWLPEPDLRNQV
jgi:hypothetical protein